MEPSLLFGRSIATQQTKVSEDTLPTCKKELNSSKIGLKTDNLLSFGLVDFFSIKAFSLLSYRISPENIKKLLTP